MHHRGWGALANMRGFFWPISGAVLALGALLLNLSGCGSSGSSSLPPEIPEYTLSASALNPGSLTAGSTATSTITITPQNGYTGTVTLSCSISGGGTPAPACAFQPGPVTVSGLTTSTLTVSTTGTPAGTYSIMVSAMDADKLAPSNGSQALSLTVTTEVVASYSLTATALSPSSVAAGGSATSTISITPVNGYTGSVTLSCGSITGGTPAPTCAFNPSVITISGSGSGTSTLTVSTTSSTAAAGYSIPVSAVDANQLGPSDGSQALSLTVTPLVVASYSLSATALSPSSVVVGGSATSTITVTPANGYTGSVTLSCSSVTGGSPAPTCGFSPSVITISGSGSGTSTLTVSTTSSTSPATYSITVSAIDANQLGPSNGSQVLSLTVMAAPSYSLKASALNPATVSAGNAATSTITVTPANGYTGSVTLSCSSITGGTHPPTCAFNPSVITIGGSSSGTSTLTVSTTSSTSLATYSITASAIDANQLGPSNGSQALSLTVTAAPSYSLSATALSPSSVTVGGSATSTITVAPANGYTGSVTLSCSSITGGTHPPTCAFNPSVITISGSSSGTSTLTVSTTSSTSLATYSITASAVDANQLGPSNGSQALSLTVTAAASYSLSATTLSPSSVTAGASATSTITVTPANGYTGSVTLSCSSITGGTHPPTCAFNPSVITISGSGSGTSTLTVSTTSSTSAATYSITVSAIDTNQLGPSNGSQALSLTVGSAVPASYSLSASALSPTSVVVGGSATSTITVTPANGYTGSVTLSCSSITGGSPAPTCGFSPSVITISSSSSGTSTLTVSTTSSTSPATYSITVSASDANHLGPSNGSQVLSLTVTAAPSYSLKASALNPSSVSAGNAATSTITVTPANGYTGSVTLSCSSITGGSPAPTCSFNPAVITISGSGSGTSTLTVSTTSSTSLATYSITVAASDANHLGPSNGSQVLSLTVTAAPSYSLKASALNPSSVSAGNAATSTITVTPANGYTGSVTLSCSSITGGSPAPTCSFNPAVITISGSGSGTSTLTVSTTSSTSLATYSITVAAIDANQLGPSNGSQVLSLTVTAAPSYSLKASALNPSSVSAGNAATSTITVTPANGYTGSVTLSCSSITGGTHPPTCAFSPSVITISGSGSGTSTLTVSTTSSTSLATYSITVSAVDANQLGPSNGSQALSLTVTAAASYSLGATALSPASVAAGGSATSTITVTPANGYTGSVTLSCSSITGGTPAPTCSFNPSVITISGSSSGTSTLTVSSTSSTAVATYSITVSASDANHLGPSNGSQLLSLTVTAAPSYSLKASALDPATVTAGKTATSTITITPADGYTGSVTLSCSSVTGGTPAPTCSFNPATVDVTGAAGTSTLTLSTTTSTPGGSYTVVVAASDANHLGPSDGSQTLAETIAGAITNVVIIFQENRTPDNLFQGLCITGYGSPGACSTTPTATQYNIQTSDWANNQVSGGVTQPGVIDLGTTGNDGNYDNYDISHQHVAFTNQCDLNSANACVMDGSDLNASLCSPNQGYSCPANPTYFYVDPADVTSYLQMAQTYAFGDQMFQTNEGPSYSAHQFIISGTSTPGTADSGDYVSDFVSENPIPNNATAGCLAATGTYAKIINPEGAETPLYNLCYEHQTLTDLLDDATPPITWRYYAPSAGSIWTAPTAINHMCVPNNTYGSATECSGSDYTAASPKVVLNQTQTNAQVLSDITSNSLQQVSWVIPTGADSDHAASNDGCGPSWVTEVVNAIGNSSYWPNTVIIVSWDDWGGWYDHVAPPQVIDDGSSWGSGYVYGFRVPLIVISPYSKSAYISHTTHDFGSILRFIENNYGLGQVGVSTGNYYADTYAPDAPNSLSDMFDFTGSPVPFTKIAVPWNDATCKSNPSIPSDPDDD